MSQDETRTARKRERASSVLDGSDLETLRMRFRACMVLGGVGDAVGFNNGHWEFCFSGIEIHKEALKNFGGIRSIDVENMCLSDDTVMHLATAQALSRWTTAQADTRINSSDPHALAERADDRTSNVGDNSNNNDSNVNTGTGRSPEEAHQFFTTRKLDRLFHFLAWEYVYCFQDMGGRAPGPTTARGVGYLESYLRKCKSMDLAPDATEYETDAGSAVDCDDSSGDDYDFLNTSKRFPSLDSLKTYDGMGRKWNTPTPKSGSGGGCGAVMRCVPIGLVFPPPSLVENTPSSDICDTFLLSVAIESARMTHNHPTGYLGAVAGSLFTALALRQIPVVCWGKWLMNIIPLAMDVATEADSSVTAESWDREHSAYFVEHWENFLHLRRISDATAQTKPHFPDHFGVEQVCHNTLVTLVRNSSLTLTTV
eukprot:TRINITY_DN17117_c0_g1_i1.p1 TRINITY_DN17117_c0_g1~~TRINITY_DN17117_c0_g1_i1.p1  ORF type:complete len:426 (-),score=40.86 TRINITY_DN17117_c0_g1_i1:193-1470(-)